MPLLRLWAFLYIYILHVVKKMGTRWRSWFRHYATTRKVAGSIPDDVGIFYLHNLSCRTMALRSTLPLT